MARKDEEASISPDPNPPTCKSWKEGSGRSSPPRSNQPQRCDCSSAQKRVAQTEKNPQASNEEHETMCKTPQHGRPVTFYSLLSGNEAMNDRKWPLPGWKSHWSHQQSSDQVRTGDLALGACGPRDLVPFYSERKLLTWNMPMQLNKYSTQPPGGLPAFPEWLSGKARRKRQSGFKLSFQV